MRDISQNFYYKMRLERRESEDLLGLIDALKPMVSPSLSMFDVPCRSVRDKIRKVLLERQSLRNIWNELINLER